ncbi:hypothetical protein H5U35_00525 [Candidatus Aerophobetes bacterium]|nr:hypothetical protein [Candidatus Aerophobetes bacterium]
MASLILSRPKVEKVLSYLKDPSLKILPEFANSAEFIILTNKQKEDFVIWKWVMM